MSSRRGGAEAVSEPSDPDPADPDPAVGPWFREPVSLAVRRMLKGRVATWEDALWCIPRRYIDTRTLTSIADLVVGDEAMVVGMVLDVKATTFRSSGGTRVVVVVGDGTDTVDVVFFAKNPNFVGYLRSQMQPGKTIMFTGKVGEYRGTPQISHPIWGDVSEAEWRTTHPLWPVYSGLTLAQGHRFERALRDVMGAHDLTELPDPIPRSVRETFGLLPVGAALAAFHQPRDFAEVQLARRTAKFAEALVLQCTLVQRRFHARQQRAVQYAPAPGGLLDAFDARLPFALTASQRRAGQELARDLGAEVPMARLLQGDVGSGKTIVALRAMLQVVQAGGQCALLAPTETLAAQHFRSISDMLGDLAFQRMLGGSENATRVVLLTGSLKTRARREAMAHAASGEAGIVVGTHALLQDKVQFAQLGLVVVDEQHRFGVDQREALRAKGTATPHVLVMTATPIPRTVAMTVFGDLDVVELEGVPAGRKPVATHIVSSHSQAWMDRMWRRMREEIDAGRQAFVVTPRIGGEDTEGAADDGWTPPADSRAGGAGDPSASEAPRPAAVVDWADTLRAEPALAGLRIGILHGRLSSEDKDAVMGRFRAGDIDLLVATTVIEVGVDVPNASVMAIIDADRFGLAQLHQLRGRIGRGEHPGVCFAVTGVDGDSAAAERLHAFAHTTDGFALAELDASQRSEGNVVGAEQSGRRSGLRHLRVFRDKDIIAAARDVATELVDADPTLAAHPQLVAAMVEAQAATGVEYIERA